MIRFNRLFLRSTLIIIFVLLLSGTLTVSFQSEASSTNPFSEILRRIQLVVKPPPQITPTGRARGGAGRGTECPAVEHSVTALAPVESPNEASDHPNNSSRIEYVWGVTAEQEPILWFYIPYSSDTLATAEFMLLDENAQPVLAQPMIIELSGTPEIVGIHISSEIAINQNYNWYFSIICDLQKPSRNPGVSGWLQRIEPSSSLLSSLNTSELQQQYLVYAQHGIWYDMVTSLIQSHQDYPDNEFIQRDWAELLIFLGLPDLTESPIIECCNSEPITN